MKSANQTNGANETLHVAQDIVAANYGLVAESEGRGIKSGGSISGHCIRIGLKAVLLLVLTPARQDRRG